MVFVFGAIAGRQSLNYIVSFDQDFIISEPEGTWSDKMDSKIDNLEVSPPQIQGFTNDWMVQEFDGEGNLLKEWKFDKDGNFRPYEPKKNHKEKIF